MFHTTSRRSCWSINLSTSLKLSSSPLLIESSYPETFLLLWYIYYYKTARRIKASIFETHITNCIDPNWFGWIPQVPPNFTMSCYWASFLRHFHILTSEFSYCTRFASSRCSNLNNAILKVIFTNHNITSRYDIHIGIQICLLLRHKLVYHS